MTGVCTVFFRSSSRFGSIFSGGEPASAAAAPAKVWPGDVGKYDVEPKFSHTPAAHQRQGCSTHAYAEFPYAGARFTWYVRGMAAPPWPHAC